MKRNLTIIVIISIFFALGCKKDDNEIINPDNNIQTNDSISTGPVITTFDAEIIDECSVHFSGEFDQSQLNSSIDLVLFLTSPYNLPDNMLIWSNQGEADIRAHQAMANSSTIIGDNTGDISSGINTYFLSGVKYYFRAVIVLENGEEHYGNIKTFEFPLPNGNGQAGGVVFYDKGSYSDGWRYLELAPYNLFELKQDFSSGVELFNWSSTNNNILGAYSNDGLLNTNEIINNCTDCIAAELCTDFSYNGYNDWFLPSELELARLRDFVNNQNDDFICKHNILERYWSSNQSSHSSKATVIRIIGSGGSYNESKTYGLHPIRPIRRY